MLGCCITCNGWRKQVSCVWRKTEQTPKNGVVCQRQVQFAFESLFRRDDQIVEAVPADVVSQFNQAFREAAEGLYGATFQQSINHNRARLSEEQAAEFGRRLLALIEEYFPPGKGDRAGIKYGFYGILTPIDLHPLEDSETEKRS